MICRPANGVCVLCGREVPETVVTQCPGVLREGLGDRIAGFLSAVGITKARAQAVARAVGLEHCGCEQRQELLNEVGYRLGIGGPGNFHDGENREKSPGQ